MTWNVQGLNQVGKLENLLNERKNLKIDVCGVSETHLTGADDFITELPSKEKYRIINSGESSKIRGVAFIISQKLINLVSSVIIVSSRVIAIRIKANPVDIFLVQGYAPTMDKDQEVKEQFNEELRDTIKKKKFNDTLILMGNFNAKLGNLKVGDTVGPHGLGIWNSSGQDLINFCIENELFVSNIWFEQKISNRHTWVSPDGVTKNQIDFICCSKRFRNGVTNAKARHNSDCGGSDHNPVIISMKIKLKKPSKRKMMTKWNLDNLKDGAIKLQFSKTCSEKLDKIFSSGYDNQNIENNWKNLKEAMTTAAQQVLGIQKQKRNNNGLQKKYYISWKKEKSSSKGIRLKIKRSTKS